MCFVYSSSRSDSAVPGSYTATRCVSLSQATQKDGLNTASINALCSSAIQGVATTAYDSFAYMTSDCTNGGGWSLQETNGAALAVAIIVPIVLFAQALACAWFAKAKRGYRGCALVLWFLVAACAPVCAWIAIVCFISEPKSAQIVPVVATAAAPAYSPYGMQAGQAFVMGPYPGYPNTFLGGQPGYARKSHALLITTT
jgi:hypothetical protein